MGTVAGALSLSLASRKLDFEKLLDLDLIETKGIGRGTYYVKKIDDYESHS